MNLKTECRNPQLRLVSTVALILTGQLLLGSGSASEKAAPLATFANLPINEITVFKDGHAFVAHEGKLPTDADGNIVMDYLPTPVLGTFWPYAAEQGVKLTSVVAGQRRVLVERTALNLRELLEANIGAEIMVAETGTNRYEATIVGLPVRSAEEQAGTNPPNTGERLPEKGNLILLKTKEGVRAVFIDRIQEVTFKHPHKPAIANEEFRNLLTLKLDWNKAKPSKSANVGMFYLQKGFRWIPNYKIEIGEDGKALVKLQATLINELADLENVSVNLVIGVPTFAFKDNTDPMALQQTLAQLSQYFRTENPMANGNFDNRFSNAIMSQSQVVQPGNFRGGSEPGGGGSLGPEIGDSTKTEDLVVFNVQHVTLKKGERMVLPIAEFTLPARDIFTLDLPFGPPPEMRGNLNTEQQRELARLLNAPKVMHKIRLSNSSKYPLTTAPALILRGGHVLAQGMMTYTSTGADVDLPITTAVDFQVKKSDLETKRTANAMEENGNHYSRIDLAGKITLTSHRLQPTEIEVTRYVLGGADTAGHAGVIEKLNVFENGDYLPAGDYPSWWSWYGWPSWWNYFNGIGRITWKLKLQPKEPLTLEYQWHYFWR
jgi:hypothetical protein